MESLSFQPQPGTLSAATARVALSLPLQEIPGAVPVSQDSPTPMVPVGAIEKFADVLPEFILLSERLSIRSLFVEPQWINAYLKAFEPSSEVFALTARQHGRLTGVLPLVRKFGQWFGAPARILRPPLNSHCHRFDVPREDGPSGSAALRAIFALLDTMTDWDVMELPKMADSENVLPELLSFAQEHKWRATHGEPAMNLYVPIEPGIGKKSDSPWLATATAAQRRDLRQAMRFVRAEIDGDVCFETITNPSAEQLSLFCRLECSGWKDVQKSAILSSAPTQQFYSEIARHYGGNRRFVLNFLFLKSQLAAGQIAIQIGDSICGLKIAYDDYFSRYAPGSLLINELLRFCWQNGIRRVELGPDSAYKRRWTDQEVRLASCFFFRRGFYGRLLYDYQFLARPRLKQALTRLRVSRATK